MADQFDDKVEDTYQAHRAYHQSYYEDCSECFKQRFFDTTNRSVVKQELKNDRA